jgi:hypothetical protein
MLWLIIITYLTLVGYFYLATAPSSTIKIQKNIKLIILDIITSMTGGFLLVIFFMVIGESGGKDGGYAKIVDDFFEYRNWRVFGYWSKGFFSVFVFGSFLTYLVTWIKRQYKNL